jgi:hypothetical protein
MIHKLWNHLQIDQVQRFFDDQPDSILSCVFAALDNELRWSEQPPFKEYLWHYEHADLTMLGWLSVFELKDGYSDEANDELRLLFIEAATNHLELSTEQEQSVVVRQWEFEHNQMIELEAKSA